MTTLKEAAMPAGVSPRFVPYQTARLWIADGDLLLWRPCNLPGRLIARYTDGVYSHVGSASWAGGVLETHEMLQWFGGRTVNLSALVRQYPGKCDVYRIRDFDGYTFSQLQRRRAGEPYNWRDLAAIGLRSATHDRIRMPWRRRLRDVSSILNHERWARLYATPATQAAFCSEATISDIREANCHAIAPDLAAWEVSPNTIAAASAVRYQCTLLWEDAG